MSKHIYYLVERLDKRKSVHVYKAMFRTPTKLHKVDYSSEFVLKDCLSSQTAEKNKNDRSVSLEGDTPSCIETRMKAPDKKDADKFVSVIDNVLSVDECNAIISRAEEAGFSQALVSVGVGVEISDLNYRNSDRCIIDDDEFADALFHRIKQFLPKNYGSNSSRKKKGWTIAGLNERMRILRYGSGQFFAEHYDGSFVRIGDIHGERAGEKSFLTVMIYMNGTILNEEKIESNNNESDKNEACCKGEINNSTSYSNNLEGGATTLIARDFTAKDQVVYPDAGRVFAFDHKLLHAGELVKAGLKYAIRTDVMYKENE